MAVRSQDAASLFETDVIGQFRVRGPDGRELDYPAYLALAPASRSGDEADVVDRVFTERALAWLGYRLADLTYNRAVGADTANRPDYVIHPTVGTAFVWENKATPESLDAGTHLDQLRRYTAGTLGYAVWCNARRILVLRFDPKGEHTILADVNVEGLFGSQQALEVERRRSRAALELVHLLLRRGRFTEFGELLDRICIDEEHFRAAAIPLRDERAQREFVSGAGQVLRYMQTAALARVDAAQRALTDAETRLARLRGEWDKATQAFLSGLPEPARSSCAARIAAVTGRLGQLGPNEVERLSTGILPEGSVSRALQRSVSSWVHVTSRVSAGMALISLESADDFRVVTAFNIWSERQPEDDLTTEEIFSEQAAYVLFVRLLLARTLEDKGLLPARIASDGGVAAWREVVGRYFGGGTAGIYASSFIELLSERVSSFYRHFFQQPVFDWFMPDDVLLVEALEFLNRYSFEGVESDLLGYTYEQYIDRVARNRKGHFLTPKDVVDYMLDSVSYDGAGVIGRTLIDPACGSGSFLVAAAVRYRRALVGSLARAARVPARAVQSGDHPQRTELARQFTHAVQHLLFGMDIDPFSCYLAELNLLIVCLVDLHHLWQHGDPAAIDRFSIYNTDSLELPFSVLQSEHAGQTTLSAVLADELLDEAHPVKARTGNFSSGFYYVISNPPYVSSKQHVMARDYRSHPFFAEVLSGDVNTYLLFIRLGVHLVASGGCLCYITPLTVLGTQSAAAARALLTSADLHVTALKRFYTGGVLFHGVDQATTILVARSGGDAPQRIAVAGGATVAECRSSEIEVATRKVLAVVPRTGARLWLVSPRLPAYTVWGRCSAHAQASIADLWQQFDCRQGDVNATYVRPYARGRGDAIRLYKGESFTRFSPLREESATFVYPPSAAADGTGRRLQELAELWSAEVGIALREVARLNTRDRLQVTFFRRGPDSRLAFDHTVWRMVGEPAKEEQLLAVLGILSSGLTAYLLNLFSASNHASLVEIGDLPAPASRSLPAAELAAHVTRCIEARHDLETRFGERLGIVFPDHEGAGVPSPSLVLHESGLPSLRVRDAEIRGDVRLSPGRGNLAGRLEIRGDAGFQSAVRLIIASMGTAGWAQIQQALMPDPVVAQQFMDRYNETKRDAALAWGNFEEQQKQIDDIIFGWYGLSETLRAEVRQGLPWARRAQPA